MQDLSAVEFESSCEQYRNKTHAMENEFDLRTRYMINQQKGIINEFGVNQLNAFTTEKDLRERLVLSKKRIIEKTNSFIPTIRLQKRKRE